MIVLPAKWYTEPRFVRMIEEIGHKYLCLFFMLESYVDDHGKELKLYVKQRGTHSLAAIAKFLMVEESDLHELIRYCITEDLITWDEMVLGFPKAKNHHLESNSKPPAEAYERICTEPPVRTYVRTNEVSMYSPPRGDSSEAASEVLLPERDSTYATYSVENLEGFDCTLEELFKDLGFGGADAHKVMDTEAKFLGGLAFNGQHKKKIRDLISKHGDEAVHGAFRVYIHQERGVSLRSYNAEKRTTTFLMICFDEKLAIYRGLIGQTTRYVEIAHDQDKLPEAAPATKLSRPDEVVQEVLGQIEAQRQVLKHQVPFPEKPWGVQVIEERQRIKGDPLDALLDEGATTN